MKFNQFQTKETSGEEQFSGRLPMEITAKVDANKQIQFLIHAEKSGNTKLPKMAAILVDAAGNTLFESTERTLASNNPHFTTVGLPKRTNTNTDKEITPQLVKYRIVSLDPEEGTAGHTLVVGVRHA